MSQLAHRATLAAVCGVLLLTFLDTTVVSVTLGSVQTDLHAGVASLQWVVNAYTLVFASLMLLAGSLGDRFGHRTVMLCGLAIFTVGSVLAACATGPGMLIAGRAVMGMGAAGSEPGTLAVVRLLYADTVQRARAIGVWAAVSGLALALGPVIGGVLVGVWSWRAVFVFNVAMAVALLAVTYRWIPQTKHRLAGRLDFAGFAVGSGALFCLIYAVISGENSGFTSPPRIALFAAGAIGLIVFSLVELRQAMPMLNLRFLDAPIVRSAIVVAFAVYFGIFSIFFFTALYLQEVVGYSAYRTAILFCPMAAVIIAAAIVTGRRIGHTHAPRPMVAGCLLSAAGILLTRALLTDHPRFAPLAVSLALSGLGFGTAVVPLTVAVIGSVPSERAGMAAAVTNTMRQIGAVVGVAALGALVNAHLTTGLTHRLDALGIPSGFQGIVITAVEEGQVPSGGAPGAVTAYGPIVTRVIHATYAAFRDGLHQALLVSALLMVVAAAYTAYSTRFHLARRPRARRPPLREAQ